LSILQQLGKIVHCCTLKPHLADARGTANGFSTYQITSHSSPFKEASYAPPYF